jgi:hypothetical protein
LFLRVFNSLLPVFSIQIFFLSANDVGAITFDFWIRLELDFLKKYYFLVLFELEGGILISSGTVAFSDLLTQALHTFESYFCVAERKDSGNRMHGICESEKFEIRFFA